MTTEELVKREAERKLYGKGLTRAECGKAWDLLLLLVELAQAVRDEDKVTGSMEAFQWRQRVQNALDAVDLYTGRGHD